MRVALLGPYPTDDHVTGGVDAVMVALATGMSRRLEIDLHVVSTMPGLKTPTVARRAGFTLHQLPHPRGERLLWHQPVVRSLLRKLGEIAPDVVHAQMAGPYADAALRSGRPAVISLHGVVAREAALAWEHSSPSIRARWIVDAWYERWIIRRARDLIATTPYTRQEYPHLPQARFHDIENPVDNVFFDVPDAPALGSRLLCIAQLIPRKDILTLLQAFARVRETTPETRLDIVGQIDADPPYAALCRETVDRLDMAEQVQFLDSQPKEALAASCARADLIVLNSLQETAPLAVAVAMAAGRAVVGTRVGGVPFMVEDGTTGLLTEPGDVSGLAAAILTLLTQPERRFAFGRAARLVARDRYHVDAVVHRTVALYTLLCAEGA